MKDKKVIFGSVGVIAVAVIFFVSLFLVKGLDNNNEGLQHNASDENQIKTESETLESITEEDTDTSPDDEEVIPFQVMFEQQYARVGEELSVKVTGVPQDSLLEYKWRVDGDTIENVSDRFLVTEDLLEHLITVEVTAGSLTETSQMYLSKLPVIYINTDRGQPIFTKTVFVDATMKIQGNDRYSSNAVPFYDGPMQIRGRGNSTWMVEKKPYRIKLDKSTDLFGMGKSKDFVLLANYYDHTLMRNTIAYDVASNMGFDAMKSIPVGLIMNGAYVGNYVLTEQIKVAKGRVPIFDWEEAAKDIAKSIGKRDQTLKEEIDKLENALKINLSWVTKGTFTYKEKDYNIADYYQVPDIKGGYLLELDHTYDEISKFRTTSGQPIMFKSPEYAKTNEEMFQYVKSYLQAFEDAVTANDYYVSFQEKKVHYSELFDMNSLVDFWILTEVFGNLDSMFKSTYMYQDIGGLFKMGPIWDFDLSAGGSSVIEFQDYTQSWQTTYRRLSPAQGKQWYRNLIKDPYFVLKSYERYHSIRETLIEDMVKEGGTIDMQEEYLKEAGNSNMKQWPSNSFWNNGNTSITYTERVDELRKWLSRHIEWLDKQFETMDTLLQSLGGFEPDDILNITEVKEGDGFVRINAIVAETSIKQVSIYYNGKLVGYSEVVNGKIAYDIPIELINVNRSNGGKNIYQIRPINSDGDVDTFGDYIVL